ncbi:hypothetical protein NY08_1510 [Rhodococcus sp. B7740]|nr:hypothetical protein NY08_1510 [Rhodococcus sp. B7740]
MGNFGERGWGISLSLVTCGNDPGGREWSLRERLAVGRT